MVSGGIAAAACLHSIRNTAPIAVDHSMALSWAEGVRACCPNIHVQLPASNIVLLHCESEEKAARIIHKMEQRPLPGMVVHILSYTYTAHYCEPTISNPDEDCIIFFSETSIRGLRSHNPRRFSPFRRFRSVGAIRSKTSEASTITPKLYPLSKCS